MKSRPGRGGLYNLILKLRGYFKLAIPNALLGCVTVACFMAYSASDLSLKIRAFANVLTSWPLSLR